MIDFIITKFIVFNSHTNPNYEKEYYHGCKSNIGRC